MPCRINKKREWSARIAVEAAAYGASAFATLTYDPEHLPEHESLSRPHYRAFTKAIGYRYFGVGEYGDVGRRPHYHFVLFGCDASLERQLWIEQRWGKGRTQLVPFSPALALYIAGYVTKKLRRPDDPRLMPHQIPEFATMSRRPALGTWVVPQLAARQSVAEVVQALDVNSQVRLDGRPYELGRTLKDKVRAAIGLPDDWKHNRGMRTRDFKEQLHRIPELLSDIQTRRETQAQRAEQTGNRRKGSL